ncbi:PTH2-domain-containing protein [Dendrothele bispora CBS 962.96]|uniref:peptidyl-tRNA hydrolase n=1 Tax=Dendrothele bispora (strain CBS 962.96) TaxID=1314807 RepID=A0A4S8MW74_DENBC|nr:PTH2-domain-containing protein [Dendrothele bispora CBS 962.96]
MFFHEEGSGVPLYVAIAIGALSAGYYTGVTLRPKKSRKSSPVPPASTVLQKDTKDAEESDSESSSDDHEEISRLELLPTDECKLVLIVRTDLGMTTGKVAAQCSHATLACYKTLLTSNPAFLRQWERTGQMKVALRCSSEDELLLMQAQAQSLNLCARSIQDAGRTQIAAGSRTVLGIAGPSRLVNQITGKLRLL